MLILHQLRLNTGTGKLCIAPNFVVCPAVPLLRISLQVPQDIRLVIDFVHITPRVKHNFRFICFLFCAGATSLPEDTAPFVAGGLAAVLLVVALLATGGLGVGSISLPSPPNPTQVAEVVQQ